MARIQVSSIIPAAVERVWDYIRDFNGLPRWFPGVTDSHIEAGPPVNQPGCVRNFGLEGGPRIREQLIELDDRDRRCHYKMIECPLPIKNYVATVKLSTGEGKNTKIEITSQFDAPPAQEKEMVGMLTGTYQGAFELLKKHFGKR
ncbi:MAG TPA: SRPBCC family protein [Candidatus Angelobacter sp.]|nr:SRPBCC family protein [Candidatus Angelobacter sp.]